MRLGQFIAKRVANTIFVVFCVATVTFMIARISGDPVAQLLPPEATQEARDALRTQLGLDGSLGTQYWNFLSGMVRGDFGMSVRYEGQPALTLYMQRLPATAELVVIAVLLSTVVGITLGLLAAAKHGGFIDAAVMWLAAIGQAVPAFYLGLMLVLLVSLQWGLLPTGGRGQWTHLILPSIVLSGSYIALTARLMRTALLDVKAFDFVRTAKAKGLSGWVVWRKHILRPAALPVITLIGLQVGGLFSGAVVTESVFTWPGVGRLAIDAIYARDFPVIQVVVVMSSVIFVVANLVVDILYTVIDPRISYG